MIQKVLMESIAFRTLAPYGAWESPIDEASLNKAIVTGPHDQSVQFPTQVLADSTGFCAIPEGFNNDPEPLTFPTQRPDGTTSQGHALFYAPQNPRFQASADTLPPCRVIVNTGSTADGSFECNLAIRYWTSRGWSVCMVNSEADLEKGNERGQDLDQQLEKAIRDCVSVACYLGGLPLPWAKLAKNESSPYSLFRLSETQENNGAHTFTLTRNSFPVKTDLLIAASACLFVSAIAFPRWNCMMSLLAGFSSALVVVFLRACFHVQSGMWMPHTETISVLPFLGVTLTTHRGFGIHGLSLMSRTESTFIPRDTILDFVMLEAIQRWQIVDYAALLTRSPGYPESEKVCVVFPHLFPPVSVYVHVYQKLHGVLFGQKIKHSARVDSAKICISGHSQDGWAVLGALRNYPGIFCGGYCDWISAPIHSEINPQTYDFQASTILCQPMLTTKAGQVPLLMCQRNQDETASPMAEAVRAYGGSLEKIEQPRGKERDLRGTARVQALRAEVRHLARAAGVAEPWSD